MSSKFIIVSLIISILIITLCSCAKEVKVYFPTQFVKINEVVVNGEQKLSDNIQDKEYSFIVLKSGTNKVSINGEEHQFFTEAGGLLNLDQKEFAVFPIYFGRRGGSFRREHSMVLDSVVYFKNHNQKFNAAYFLEYYKTNNPKPYAEVNHMEYAGIIKSDFFAEKTWDIDINEEIPTQIKVKTQKGFENIAGGYRKVIQPAEFFKRYIMLSDEYTSVDLRTMK